MSDRTFIAVLMDDDLSGSLDPDHANASLLEVFGPFPSSRAAAEWIDGSNNDARWLCQVHEVMPPTPTDELTKTKVLEWDSATWQLAADAIAEARHLAASWHDGMADPLYALSSTGGVVVMWGGPTLSTQLFRILDHLEEEGIGGDLEREEEARTIRAAAAFTEELELFTHHVAESSGTWVDPDGVTDWDALADWLGMSMPQGWRAMVSSPGVFSKGRRLSVFPPGAGA